MPPEEALRGARIVIVDDEVANIRLLQRYLVNDGYTNVASVTESRELFEGDALNEADLILLDLHMPQPDGFAVLQSLRRPGLKDQLPVLVLTGDTTADSRNRALAMGANDYISKPLDMVEVLLRVRNLLQNRLLHVRLQKTNRLLQDRLLQLEGPG